MQEEIDIRPYVEALLDHKWLILVATAVSAAIAIAVVVLSPTTYQATSLVAVLEPNQLIQLDPRFQTIQNESQLQHAYPELARSDELMTALLAEPSANEFESVDSLRRHLTSEPASDPGLLRLKAEHTDPEEAMHLANDWARLFVKWVDEAYGDQGVDQFQFFSGQLEDTTQRLSVAEDALIEFQAQNRLTIVGNELNALNTLQADYLSRSNALTLLLDDIQALQMQVESSPQSVVALASQLTILGLQSRAFSTQGELPLLLQLDANQFASANQNEQRLLLESLALSVSEMIQNAEEDALALAPEVLALQQTQQELQAELNALSRNQKLLEETTISLARKVDEESIASQDSSGGVRLVSEASIPTLHTQPSMLIVAILGGLVGLGLSSFIVVMAKWWKQ